MMDKQRLKKAMSKMASMETNETKWEKRWDNKFYTMHKVHPPFGEMKAFILSTLEEYADATRRILDTEVPREEEVWGKLDKLEVEYGIKNDKA